MRSNSSMSEKIIKKHKNKNEYLLTDSKLWVRNFCKNINPLDINELISPSDYDLLVKNELENHTLKLSILDPDAHWHRKIVIVSDGYGIKEKQEILRSLPDDVKVIGVNNILNKLNNNIKINYYLINNPYKESLSFFPKAYYPVCIASSRTSPSFVKRYLKRNIVYQYFPVPTNRFYHSRKDVIYKIDDYRNPICGAISISYKFDVDKLVLLCCDDMFKGERPGSVQLQDDYHEYPQQKVGDNLIDGNLYWLQNQEEKEVQIAYHSEVPVFSNAKYLQLDEIIDFLK